MYLNGALPRRALERARLPYLSQRLLGGRGVHPNPQATQVSNPFLRPFLIPRLVLDTLFPLLLLHFVLTPTADLLCPASAMGAGRRDGCVGGNSVGGAPQQRDGCDTAERKLVDSGQFPNKRERERDTEDQGATWGFGISRIEGRRGWAGDKGVGDGDHRTRAEAAELTAVVAMAAMLVEAMGSRPSRHDRACAVSTE